MSVVEVRSHNIWFKHIRGNDQLVARLNSLREGEKIALIIDGLTGEWEKMRNGTSGNLPTAGIKPIGKAKKHWHALQLKRGKKVEIRELEIRTKVAKKRQGYVPMTTIVINCPACGGHVSLNAPSNSSWQKCPGCGFTRRTVG